MTNPEIIEIPAEEWTKVATGVKNGSVWILDHSTEYLYTTRDTGDPAPTSTEEGGIFEDKDRYIYNTVLIDVYLYAKTGGKVAVAL